MLERVLDDPLIDQIAATPGSNIPEFWSFKNSSKRKGAHALLHYPAMMVPNLQGILLDAVTAVRPQTTKVLDPFVGSGTTLVESMSRGLDFVGVDINPLAKLACAVKSGPYYVDAFCDKALELTARVRSDPGREYFVRFRGQRKWIEPSVSIALSRIARSIERENDLWARRLFWLALARVVRFTSNSRTSTYKLHVRKTDDTARRDTFELFESTLNKFATHLHDQHDAWKAKGLLRKGRYVGNTDIRLGDSREVLVSRGALADVVMTSPPYGDNATTIPYGQYAFLPLQWIPAPDIDPDLGAELTASTHATDAASLGGSLRDAIDRANDLTASYPSARLFRRRLGGNDFGVKRFAAFFADLNVCASRISAATASGGYQIWTIGSRRIGGFRVPMEDILAEMLQASGVETIGRIHRKIHAKKMATRNSVSETMSTEVVLLAKKCREAHAERRT